MPSLTEHAQNRSLTAALAAIVALDSSLDATAAIQDALNAGASLVPMPRGTYRVDGMLTVPAETTLKLTGATLLRPAAATSTDPVVHLKGTNARLHGGRVTTEKAHPNGVVIVGHLDAASNWNVNNCSIRDTTIRGVQAAGNIGIKLMSSQPVLGVAYSSYFHVLDNVHIRGADIGMLFTEKSNGCTILAPSFWDCITSAITFAGAYANTVVGGFVHTCTNGVVGVQFLNHTSQPFSTHHADCNTVSGFNVEPQGTTTKGVTIANQCESNYIEIMSNVAGGNTILNQNNTVLSRFGKQLFPANRTIEHQGQSTGRTYVANQGEGTCTENATVDLVSIALGSRKSVLVDIELVCTNQSLDNPTVLRRQYAVKNVAGVFTFTTLDGQTDGNGLTISWSSPATGVAKLAVTSFNNGTVTTYIYGWSIRVRGSTLPSVTWL